MKNKNFVTEGVPDSDLKITEELIYYLNMQKKYAHFFKDYPEDNNWILIRKDFPLPELKENELRIFLAAMLSVKE